MATSTARLEDRCGCATPRKRIEIYKRDGGRCLNCGNRVRLFARWRGDMTAGEIDHIIPQSMGGTNSDSNLQLLCILCNRRKYNNA